MNPELMRSVASVPAPVHFKTVPLMWSSAWSCSVTRRANSTTRVSWLEIFSRTRRMFPSMRASATLISVSSLDIFGPHNSRRVVGAERDTQLLGYFYRCVDVLGLGGGGLYA